MKYALPWQHIDFAGLNLLHSYHRKVFNHNGEIGEVKVFRATPSWFWTVQIGAFHESGYTGSLDTAKEEADHCLEVLQFRLINNEKYLIFV